MRPIASFSAGPCAATCLFASGASAATKIRIITRTRLPSISDQRPPLTVNKRSWLDPGHVVPQGSMQNYVTENTGFNQTPDQAYFPSRFHEDSCPRRFIRPAGRSRWSSSGRRPIPTKGRPDASQNSKCAITGTWSEGRSQPRLSRKTFMPQRCATGFR